MKGWKVLHLLHQGRQLVVAAVLLMAASCQHLPAPEVPADGDGDGGTIRLQSLPATARVEIDGEPTQLRTPTIITSLTPGEHRLALTLNGYRRWEEKVLMADGDRINLDIRLEPTATGSLDISSVPFQSWIFIDGRATPKVTPATVDGLPVGTHTVLLRQEGYEDWTQAVVVMENTQIPVTASLKPAKGLRGNLNVQTYPPGARVSVDSSLSGEETPTTLFNLMAGVHVVELEKEGDKAWRDEVSIREEATSNLLVTLRRSEPRRWGSAVITSSPEEAEVILDGIHVRSTTPVFFETITDGEHTLSLEMEGYRPWHGKLTIQQGEKTEIHVTLRPR